MPVCDQCGNDYDKAFTVEIGRRRMTFDSFECAIAGAAPRCRHCGVPVIGHGLEQKDAIFCCAHCAGRHGAKEVRDRA